MREAISREQLLERLAAGHSAGVTVVTPNRRLAAALTADFDAYQAGYGRSVWEAADILPLAAFIERLWSDAQVALPARDLPLLLTGSQEQERWEAILRESGLLVVPKAAAQCRDAWLLAHAWRIKLRGGSDDAVAFGEWARAYEKSTAQELDAAQLPDRVATLLREGALRAPKLLVAYAFDIVTPQATQFLEALASQGARIAECAPPRRAGARHVRAAFSTAREELEAAASWARARLEAGSARIGVVVPELAERRKEVKRVFTRVAGAEAFNVSLGEPLSAVPLVAAALALLGACVGEMPLARASALVRSPFIDGAESEMAQRARLDARLRRELGAAVTLPKLLAQVAEAPILRRALERLYNHAEHSFAGERSPHHWARAFSAALEAAGFPGERALDSAEYQGNAKLHEVLGELACLARVAPAMSFARAFASFRRLCEQTLFQPESGEAPIQVLGILESAGLGFEHLWIGGLTDEAWPLDARPNPFLPVRAQREAGVPQAAAETSLALDRRITEQWMAAAGEVVFSHALKDGDRELAASPLIASIAAGEVPLPARMRHRDLIFAARQSEPMEPDAAPPYAQARVRGGTRVLADQSACPFRAFARHRLAAQPLEEPTEGPDAAQRGILLHELMKQLWSSLKGSAALAGELSSAIAAAAAAAVRECALEGRFAAIERERLEKRAREWLEVERGRSAFEVAALEEKRQLVAGGLEFSGRIDRMDRLADGSYALIDYKTGNRLTPRHWMDARPDDPQLPLYAVSAAEDVAAVAFAKLRTGAMRFMGYAREKDALPGLTRYDTWETLMAGWKAEIERLARGFAAGDASIDPKRGLQTCQQCDLQTLCRVYERFNALAEGEEGAE